MRVKQILLAAAISAFAASAAQAEIVYNENFNNFPLKLDAAPAGWVLTTEGTVSLIGSGVQSDPQNPILSDPLPGNGVYVDLIGGNDATPATLLTPNIRLVAGVEYTAQFALAGNQSTGTELVHVEFGDAQGDYALAATDNFRTFTLNFTPTSSADYAVTFQTVGYNSRLAGAVPDIGGGGSARGAFLDNVVVTSVPEPASYALMLAGLIGLHLVARRRIQH